MVSPTVGIGLDAIVPVPGGEAWHPVRIFFESICSVNIGNRYAYIWGESGGLPCRMFGFNNNPLAALSVTDNLFMKTNPPNFYFVGYSFSNFSDGWCLPGEQFRIGLINIDPGDRLTNCIFEFQRRLV